MSLDVISKKEIARSFGDAASSYDAAAHFQRWVGEKLLEKLPVADYECTIDLGCGTGYFSEALSKKTSASDSFYLGVDLAEDMLKYSRGLHGGHRKVWACGDAESLPLTSESTDLIFSSLALQWCADTDNLFTELFRVLKPGGRLAFSTLVDGSLRELKESWEAVDSYQHVNHFATKVEYETSLRKLPFHFVCNEQVTKVLHYDKLTELTHELKSIGAHNVTANRPSGLTGKAKLRGLISAYETYRNDLGLLPASYEVLLVVVQKPFSER